jgi:hypothetical protein
MICSTRARSPNCWAWRQPMSSTSTAGAARTYPLQSSHAGGFAFGYAAMWRPGPETQVGPTHACGATPNNDASGPDRRSVAAALMLRRTGVGRHQNCPVASNNNYKGSPEADNSSRSVRDSRTPIGRRRRPPVVRCAAARSPAEDRCAVWAPVSKAGRTTFWAGVMCAPGTALRDGRPPWARML